MQILNFGSLNIDHVYAVEHFARAGETLDTDHYRVFAGGKGFNQSIALARAGARVAHANPFADQRRSIWSGHLSTSCVPRWTGRNPPP